MTRRPLPYLFATLALAALVVTIPSCDSGYGFATGCNSTDQCESDFTCLPFCGVTDNGSICTIPCTTDAECEAVYEGGKCWDYCELGGVCFIYE
jgi:hypothetical protein